MGRGHNGMGAQWDGDTMGRGHNDTYPLPMGPLWKRKVIEEREGYSDLHVEVIEEREDYSGLHVEVIEEREGYSVEVIEEREVTVTSM
ncbi:hypothetical protein ACOMHN_065469 [Nucella lapillus]